MRYHGGGPIKPYSDSQPHEAEISVGATHEPAGFRHYRLTGRDAPASGDRQASAALAAKLELRMTAPFNWTAAPADLPGANDAVSRPQPDPQDNPYIPSGYTYFAQFVAHDMVATRVPFWATETLDTDTMNDRATRLRLDSLYGTGPGSLPIIYAAADADDQSRAKLQIGQAGPVALPAGAAPIGAAQAGAGGTICPFRDIGRLKLSRTLHDLPGLTEALVADQRNDDHALISQLTMVFSHLHNIFVDRQKPVDADDPLFSFTRDAARLFAKAREATTLVYRHLVRHDLLKRLLHPAVHALYDAADGPFLDQLAGTPGSALPVEFSHAAFRFGHAMVRDTYQVNQGSPATGLPLQGALQHFSSARNVHMAPMSESWLVQWSNFFNMAGRTDPARINLSRRIGPRAPLSLFGTVFGPIDPSLVRGIFYRDLISADLANLWSVRDLLAVMREEPRLKPIIAGSALLRDDRWPQAIAAWLPGGVFPAGSPGPWDGLTDNERQREIDAIATDPPLPFFVLFEAAMDEESQGCRLGRLGSVLVAETIFAELRNRLAAEAQSESLEQQLISLDPGFADDVFNEPVTMASVIGFVDRCLQASPDPLMRYPSLL